MRRMRKTSRGYTAVEVLSAMFLLAIGAAGVIGMQKVTIQGGNDARRFDIASNIAREWAEKLQRDSTFWTQENADFSTTSNVTTNTQFLRDISAGACTGANWCVPNINGGRNPPAVFTGCQGAPQTIGCVDTFAYDAMGRGIGQYVAGNIETEAHFCVQYRLNYIVDGVVGQFPHHAIRAEIRVIFNHLEYGAIPNCANILGTGPDPSNMPTAAYRYHYVYLTTLLRRNPIQ
jgi:hypothetical protein